MRPDGTHLKELVPIAQALHYIMPRSQNRASDSLDEDGPASGGSGSLWAR